MPKKITDLPLDITAAAMGQYLTDKDKSTLSVVSKTTQSLFQPARLQKMANKLLLQVMHGEQEKAEKILKIRPELLTMTGTATDYSGRTFETTAFRYALWALDTRYMCNMMLDCLPYSEQGEAIKQDLLSQFNAQEQNGLDYELNGETIHESHYDFSPIKAALQTYIDNYLAQNRDRLDKWSNVVGLAQAFVPAHVAQHYCDPEEAFYPTPSFNKKTFKRSLEFLHSIADARKLWFNRSSYCPRWAAGAIVRSALVRAPIWGGEAGIQARERDLAALTALCEVRTRDLVFLMQRLEGPIQKPYSNPDLRHSR